MKVITLLNEKGGVGKTTLSIHLAAGLARQGYRTLFIDTDAQEANATAQLGMSQRPAIYNLLVRPNMPDGEWQRNVEVVDSAKLGDSDATLFWVSSNLETRDIATKIRDGMIVRKRLNQMRDALDFVVFDTSPTPDLFHATILAATDYLLIPTQLEEPSLVAVRATVQRLEENRTYLSQYGVGTAKLLGIVPNMFRSGTSIHSYNLAELLANDQYGEYVWDPISMSVVFAESTLAHETLYAYDLNHQCTVQLEEMVGRVLSGIQSYEQAE